MTKGRPLKPLEVSPDTREELASMARSRSLPAGLVCRAKIVLLCAEGLDNSAVAERLRVSRQTVGHRHTAWVPDWCLVPGTSVCGCWDDTHRDRFALYYQVLNRARWFALMFGLDETIQQ